MHGMWPRRSWCWVQGLSDFTVITWKHMQGMQQSLFDSQAHVVEGHRFCTKYETFRFFLPADSLKFYPIILTKNSHFFLKPSTYRLGSLSNCTIASNNRAEKCKELDFWRWNFWTAKCLNFRTVSPCEGVKGTHERKKFKLVENSSGTFKILRWWRGL